MKIRSRDFGEVEIGPQDIVEFQSPIYGFEHLKRYVFLHEEQNQHIVWLQSLEDHEICFVLIDPTVVDSSYCPELPADVRTLIGEGQYFYWLIVVVSQDFRKSTVNMKSPIVVNIERCLAAQVILEENYPIRRPLFEKRGGTSC